MKSLQINDENRIKKIIFFSPNWIGDTIMSTPAVSSFKKALPSAYIVMVVKPYVYSLWKTNPFVDEIWVFNAPRIYNIFVYLKLFWKIKKNHFDLAIILPHYFRYAWITFLASIPYRIGYDVCNQGVFLTHCLNYSLNLRKKHMIENYLDILRVMGIEPKNKELVLNIDFDTQLKAEKILQENGVSLEDLVIGIAPGAIYGPAKRWPIDRYAEVADNLIQKYNAKIIIFISPKEKELTYELKNFMRYNPFIFIGDNSLLEVAALIKRCNPFITNDSGLMHIAAAVKTKIIAIFGSTSSVWTRPYGNNHIMVKKEINCSPCFKRECPIKTYTCLNLITVDDILGIIDSYMKEKVALIN